MKSLNTFSKNNLNAFITDLSKFFDSSYQKSDHDNTDKNKTVKIDNSTLTAMHQITHLENLKDRLFLDYEALKNSLKAYPYIDHEKNEFFKRIKQVISLLNDKPHMINKYFEDVKNILSFDKTQNIEDQQQKINLCYLAAIKIIKENLKELEKNLKFSQKIVEYVDPRKINIEDHLEAIKRGEIYLLNKNTRNENFSRIFSIDPTISIDFLGFKKWENKENITHLPSRSLSYTIGNQHFRNMPKFESKKVRKIINIQNKTGEFNIFKPVFGYTESGELKEIVTFNCSGENFFKDDPIKKVQAQKNNIIKIIKFFESDQKISISDLLGHKKPQKNKTTKKQKNKTTKKQKNNTTLQNRGYSKINNQGLFFEKFTPRIFSDLEISRCLNIFDRLSMLRHNEFFKIYNIFDKPSTSYDMLLMSLSNLSTFEKITNDAKQAKFTEYPLLFQGQSQNIRKKIRVKDYANPKTYHAPKLKSIKPRGKKGYRHLISKTDWNKNKSKTYINHGVFNDDLEVFYSQSSINCYPHFLEFIEDQIVLDRQLTYFYQVYYNKLSHFEVFADWIKTKKDIKIEYVHYCDILEIFHHEIVEKIGYNPLKKIKQSGSRYDQCLDKIRTIATHILKNRISFKNNALIFDPSISIEIKDLTRLLLANCKYNTVLKTLPVSVEYRPTNTQQTSGNQGKRKELFDRNIDKPLKIIKEFFKK